jgi:hypothetical protein
MILYLLAHLKKQESVELQTIKKFDIAPESVVFRPFWLNRYGWKHFKISQLIHTLNAQQIQYGQIITWSSLHFFQTVYNLHENKKNPRSAKKLLKSQFATYCLVVFRFYVSFFKSFGKSLV